MLNVCAYDFLSHLYHLLMDDFELIRDDNWMDLGWITLWDKAIPKLARTCLSLSQWWDGYPNKPIPLSSLNLIQFLLDSYFKFVWAYDLVLAIRDSNLIFSKLNSCQKQSLFLVDFVLETIQSIFFLKILVKWFHKKLV